MKDPWPQVSQTTLAEQVYQIIRDRVLGGDIPPGEFIREQEVSLALGVSRTPVREALGRLASEGFAERIPHRGFRIPDEPMEALLDLYPIVSALEVLAGESAFPRFDRRDLARLWRVNSEMQQAVMDDDPPAGIELNRQFHQLLCEKCGNRKLIDMLDELRSRVVRLELWSFTHIRQREGSLNQHVEILKSIEARDYGHALITLRSNRLDTYASLVRELGRNGSG